MRKRACFRKWAGLTLSRNPDIIVTMAGINRKHRKRERTLGQAIGLALAATLGVGLLIFLGLFLLPQSALHQFYLLAHYNSSSTLPTSRLFQQQMDNIDLEEALLVTPLSLLCGGLTLGWCAPRYSAARRVLFAGGATALGVLALCLAFVWPATVYQQNLLNTHEGGQITLSTIPVSLILRQALLSLVWTAVCVLGTWLGLRLRVRSARGQKPTPILKAARR